MDKIASFQIDHDKLGQGIYLSRIDGKFKNIKTWDLRLTKPNTEPHLDSAVAHTIEHLAATVLRNHPQYKNNIIYFGPMGCLTGFYLLTEGLDSETVVPLVKETFEKVSDWADEIPGAARKDCGSYKLHDLPGAKKAAGKFVADLAAVWDGSVNYKP